MSTKTQGSACSDHVVPYIPYGRQWLDDADIEAVTRVLRSDWLTCGAEVEAFEEALAAYCEVPYAVVVSSGTAALHLALLAAGIGSGDRVLTSPMTFLASANSAEYVGAVAGFVDVEEGAATLCPGALEAAWTKDVRVVVAVDYAGCPADLPAIAAVAHREGALVIEDACHAIGASFVHEARPFPVGGLPWSDATVFSFHPVKCMTSGEGGAVLTADAHLADRVRMLRNHGIQRPFDRPGPWFYQMEELGFNYRLSDLHCALGRSQLGKLDGFVQRRNSIVNRYNAAFETLPSVHLPPLRTDTLPAWHLYVLRIDFARLNTTRVEVMRRFLRARALAHRFIIFPSIFSRTTHPSTGMGKGRIPWRRRTMRHA